jgi:hypothetical protein
MVAILFDVLLNTKISSEVRNAIGHEHSGSFFPVAQKAVPFIIQVPLYGKHYVAKNCAINILIDLYYYCFFSMEHDDNDKGWKCFTIDAIKAAVSENRENFTQFFADDSRNASLSKSLMDVLQ